jgi:ABC-2 type transport system permease protein
MTDRIKRIRAIVLNGCKQYKWICISWAFVLLSIMPTRMLMFRSHDSIQISEQMVRYAKSFQTFTQPLLIIYLLIAPVVSVMIIFSHLHQKNRVDLVHQLPLTRMDLLVGRGLIAYCSVWIPLMLTGIVVYALQGLRPEFQNVLEWKYLLQWMIHGSIFLLLHTSITIFMGFLTGMIATHGLFTIIAYLFPLGMYFLILGNMSLLIQTYEFSFDLSNQFSWWLPIMRINLEGPFPIIQDFIYLVVGLLFFFGAYLLYRIRHLEAAGNVIAFAKLNRIFKYGMGFSFLLVGGPFFYALSDGISFWLYIGYALGGLFGFFLAEVLIQKSFHIMSHWKGFLVFASISILLIGCLHMDLLGIQNWQPKASSIQGFTISGTDWYYYQKDEEPIPINQSLKEKTLALQAEMILATLPEETPGTETIYCFYRLEHGGESRRRYTLDDNFLNTTYLAYLADPEVKNLNFPILLTDIAEVESVTLSSRLISGREININDKNEIESLTKVIRTDINGLNSDFYGDYQPDRRDNTFAYAELLDQDGQTILNIPLRNDYARTIEQLAITERLERLILTPAAVESIRLNANDDLGTSKIINDPSDIEALLDFINNSGDRTWEKTDYELTIYFKDREIHDLYYPINTDELPLALQK